MASPGSPLNRVFDRIVTINLRRRPDRRAEFESDRPAFSTDWFEAVDGAAVPNPLHWRSGSGAWGCMQSHRQILERAILDGVKSLLVLEDDAKFVGGFDRKFEEFMAAVPHDWHGFMLGGQHQSPAIPMSPGVVRCVNTQRTHAYAVRGEYLRELYRVWVSGAGHCDHLMGPMHGTWRVYAPDPFLIAQRAGVSDISCREEGHRTWSKGAAALRLLVTDCPEKSWVDRLIRQGAHVGYWRDPGTGLDRGVIGAYTADEKHFKAEIAKWWDFVKYEAGAIDGGVPLLWHPEAINRYDWLVRAGLGVPVVKASITGESVLEKL